jgi:tetratricopeptide (TPR) repeat protein
MPLDIAEDLPPGLLVAHDDHQAGRHAKAEAGYAAVLAAHPGQPEALFFSGMLAFQTGRSADAIARLQASAAARPDHAESHFALANALWQAGRKQEAVAAWQATLALEASHAGALLNLAKARADSGDYGATIALCHLAAQLAPHDPGTHAALAAALLGGCQPEAALQSLDRSLALAPNLAEAHFLRGNALKALHRLDEAAKALATAVELAPNHGKARLNLANTLLAQDRPAEAEAQCRAALAAEPRLAEAHASLGCLLTNTGRLPEAIAACEEAIRLRPDFAEAHWNLGIARLLGGDLPGGFAEYEWRKRHPLHGKDFPRPPQPEWLGGELRGQELLVLAEQGLGDAIMFARYLPLLAERGARVTLACDRRLTPLLGRLPGVARVVPKELAPPECQLWVDQMTLPLRFGTTLASIPGAAGYLRADAARAGAWATRLPRRRGGARRIGLVWAGNPLHSNDARRSCPWSALAPLIRAQDEFVSLQVGPNAVEAKRLGLADLSPDLTDFAETAAVLAGCDLLITVDTAVAHCAGALGKPVWLLLPHAPDWRWLLGRADSPWYASMRLFRQPKPGDWDGVVAEVAAALAAG